MERFFMFRGWLKGGKGKEGGATGKSEFYHEAH